MAKTFNFIGELYKNKNERVFSSDDTREIERILLDMIDIYVKPEAYTNESDGFEYQLDYQSMTYGVINSGNCNDSCMRIPNSYNGLPVTTIISLANKSGTDNQNITEIIIPEGVTHILSGAFSGLPNISYISIPHTIELMDIGSIIDILPNIQYKEYRNAYYLGNKNNPYLLLVKAKNTSITSCIIHNDTIVIGDSAFRDCDMLTSISLPNYLKVISDRAFYNCTSLKTVSLSGGLRILGNMAFYNCGNLEKINCGLIYDTLTKIGDKVFYNCNKLEVTESSGIGYGIYYYTSGQNTTHTNVGLIMNIVDKTRESYDIVGYVVPDYFMFFMANMKSINIQCNIIGINSFAGCTLLSQVSLSNNVKEIHRDAFNGCTSLISIDIPYTVNVFDEGVFAACSSLKSINVHQYNAYYKTIDGNMYSKNGNIFIAYAPGKSDIGFKINDGVECIRPLAFNACTNLQSIAIPKTVDEIYYLAFSGCTAIQYYDFTEFDSLCPPSLIGIDIFDGIDNYEIRVRTQEIADAWKLAWTEYADHIVVYES